MTAPLALYVHWPFCVAKCPYCDFNSHAAGAVDQGVWRDALVSEMEYWAGQTGGQRLESIFFGGGTPSLMDPATVGALLEKANDLWGLSDDIEVTLEANPSSVEVGRFRGYRAAGVNRVSIGVQALDDDSLRTLGRVHGAGEALAAIEAARATFERFSFDLIYARTGQTVSGWQRELARALDLAGGHLSLYQLTIEPGTAYFREGRTAADEDLAVELFELTQVMTDAAGLPAYEISNHARPGEECRHNLVYWQGGEYVGVGPGAHGRVRRDGAWQAVHQTATPDRWLAAVQAQGHGTAKETPLTGAERAEERVMTGLRLTGGLDTAALAELESVIDADAMAGLIEEGLLLHDRNGLRVTPAGRLVLNGVIAALLGD